MTKFTQHTGIGVPLAATDVDTDAIIPEAVSTEGDPHRFCASMI